MVTNCDAFPLLTGIAEDFGCAGVELWASVLHLMSRLTEDIADSSLGGEQAEINACLNGDHEAYERLVRRYQQQIGNLLWRFTHNPAEHEDLVHLVFVEAWVSLAKYRGNGSFPAWLSTIATRVGYAFWKRQAKARKRNEISLEHVAERLANRSDTQDPEEFECLERALALLSPRDRLVLTLLYLEENTVEEAAELAGWSQSMVKVQAHRARKRLRKLLEGHDGHGS